SFENTFRRLLPRVVLAAAFFHIAPPSLSASQAEIACVGDVMMAYHLKPVLKRKGPHYPFDKIRALLKKSDFVFGNLENPIGTTGEEYPDKEYIFRMEPAHAAALWEAGFRVMSLANNHILDFGPEALAETGRHLYDQGIASCGAGKNIEEARKPAVVMVRGKRIAFLAYSLTFPIAFSAGPSTPGTAFADEKLVREDIAHAKKYCTWVIVSFHWGEEYTYLPSDLQRKLAHTAIDAGADAVIGHHPHVAQGLERYKKKIIAYSLGNFVFGTRNPNAVEGLVLKLKLRTGHSPRAEILPVLVQNTKTGFQTRPLKKAALRKFIHRLKQLSAELDTSLRVKKGRVLLP
ncbi:MAG TPA: CapA family protein, partial [Elusimicrobiota bacterium]|nr:CapA family protein [Elusimicrobiota bacterium]